MNHPDAFPQPPAASTLPITNTYILEGLDCSDCAAKLEKKLLAIPDVVTATINFGAGKLTITHTNTTESIIKIIHQSGYGIAANDPKQPAKQWWHDARIIATAISGFFLSIATIWDMSGSNSQLIIPLYLTAMLAGGYHVAKSGIYGLRSYTLDSNFLMTVAAIGAAAIGEWSESATVVFLFSLGNTLQSYTMDKTRQSLRTMMQFAPREALIRRDNLEQVLPIEEIQIEDVILVKPGEGIAMDGIVMNGLSTVNQAAITGESIPIEKKIGDDVYAGTMNEQGFLEIRVTKLAKDSTLSKIIHLVEEAQAAKAPMQQFVDVFAKYYTPLVIIGTLLLLLVPWLIFHQPFETWFYRSLILLVISCPCALVISTPVSIVSAIGNASRQGILIKGGVFLEKMSTIKAIAFDKTGTLTYGRPVVTDILPLCDMSADQLLLLAASVENLSEHPIAQAIVNKAKPLELKPVTLFKILMGKGAQGDIDGQTIYTGNTRLFIDLGQQVSLPISKITNLEQQGKTVILLGTRDALFGLIAVADTLRDTSKAALQKLRDTGIENLFMLTGDNQYTAKNIGTQLELNAVYSELLPQDKVSTIKELTKQYSTVAMIGDGINDAPALAVSTIGIAMGTTGSDTALETADIALMNDDLTKLSYLITLSRKTLTIIKQNITFSLVVKLLFIALTLVGFSNLWMAVFADTGAALLVIANGMRLMR
jgi:Cd2+/Zn2+-exporting ATPase